MDLAGVIRIRHHIDHAFLAAEGGHIGYDVAPGYRKKGYGTHILALGLHVAKALGIEKALLITDEDNVASRKIIEYCGGVHERTHGSEHYGGSIVRYWIEVTKA